MIERPFPVSLATVPPDELSALPFSADEYSARLIALRDAMAESGVDVAIITAPDTMAWLHGYRSRWYRQHTSSSLPPALCTVVHVSEGEPFMIDSQYHEGLVGATSTIRDFRPVPGSSDFHEPSLTDYVAFLTEQVSPWRGSVVGLELWSCIPSPAVSRVIESMLTSLGCQVVDVSMPFRGIRRRKTAAEIAKIERAQAACDAGLLALQEQATPETSGIEAWALWNLAMVRAGGEPAALHETVASGHDTWAIHSLSSREPLGRSEMFYPDMAASFDGYHARATRPFSFGAPPAELSRLAGVAAGVYDVIGEFGTIGTPWRTLFGHVREFLNANGVEGGACGYELGLSVPPTDFVGEFTWSIHEDIDGVIEPGLVTNFESFNEVVLVDTVVFEDGGPRFLSALPRDVMVIE